MNLWHELWPVPAVFAAFLVPFVAALEYTHGSVVMLAWAPLYIGLPVLLLAWLVNRP